MALIDAHLAAAAASLADRLSDATSLEEDLFDVVATELRHLRPARKLVTSVRDYWLYGTPSDDASDPAPSSRPSHLERLAGSLTRHRNGGSLTAMECQLYWTLYTGVISFWARDSSPHQEDTLAILHQSIRMFVRWLDQERLTAQQA